MCNFCRCLILAEFLGHNNMKFGYTIYEPGDEFRYISWRKKFLLNIPIAWKVTTIALQLECSQMSLIIKCFKINVWNKTKDFWSKKISFDVMIFFMKKNLSSRLHDTQDVFSITFSLLATNLSQFLNFCVLAKLVNENIYQKLLVLQHFVVFLWCDSLFDPLPQLVPLCYLFSGTVYDLVPVPALQSVAGQAHL